MANGFQASHADWLTSGIPADFADLEGFERSVCYFHDDNANDASSDRADAAAFGNRLAWDPDIQSAGWNHSIFKVDELTTPLTQTQKENARANAANTALKLGTRTTGGRLFIDPGHNLNNRPVDHIISADWLRLACGIPSLRRGRPFTV